MEALTEHSLEPALQADVPRRLSLPLRERLLLAVALLLLALFTLGGCRALWEGGELAWLAGSGRSVTGRIVEIRSDPPLSEGKAGLQTAVRYAVSLPGPDGPRLFSEWATQPASSAAETGRAAGTPQFFLGQPLPLRSARFLGLTVCRPWDSSAGARILSLLLAGGLILAVSLLLLRRLLRDTGKRLSLLRRGTATIGTVLHKRTESEDMVRYFLCYGYADSAAQRREREEQVSAAQWQMFSVGEPVTVLYAPAHPETAGLYALLGDSPPVP